MMVASLLLRGLHLLQAHLVWLLLGTYAFAAFVPEPGLALRAASAGALHLGGAALDLSLPACLLALLLFNASLSVDFKHVHALWRRPRLLLGGLLANTFLPLAFVFLTALAFSAWEDAEELQGLLVGLTLVGAMPIAGASTAWSQNAEGNLALSLGLVLTSTLLSPLVTPFGFHAAARVTSDDYAQKLHALAGANTQFFLVGAVVLPSLVGALLRYVLGARRLRRAMPFVKFANIVCLLLLNYANAAVSLPHILRHPSWEYLVLVFGCVTTLCAVAFVGGNFLGRVLGGSNSERVSLMFGLGMNNNGSGLVLASATMADHPNVLLAIVAYNLVQQVGAGIAHAWRGRRQLNAQTV